ncbi:MAG: YfcE family phosphodiesterase [Clostridia bacterium]|nr:YfcE family phosphodiesterase [Clostridia bacterium]
MVRFMKLAIFSDTHGRTAGMLRAVRQASPDVLVHLGDYVRDASKLEENFPDLPLWSVSGNCDLASNLPDTITFMVGPVNIFATHGHRYFVKNGTGPLLNAARIKGTSLVLYGHTHIARFENIAGMSLLNPGTAGGSSPTFAIAEIDDEGGIICRIMDI